MDDLPGTIAGHGLLSKAEEAWLLARLPCPHARDRLALSNVRLVASIAKRFYGLPLEDLVQEGMAGLLEAIDLFDPTRHVRLATYATWRIRLHIGRAVFERADLIRVPEPQQRALRRGDATRGEDTESPCLVAASRARRVVNEGAWASHSPLDEVLGREPEAGEEAAAREEAHRVRQLLATLPPREETVLRLRFGIGCPPRTLREVGEVVGVTKERARQIENEGLRRLRLKGMVG